MVLVPKIRMNLSQKVVWNSVASAGGRAVSSLLTLVIVGLLTRYLGKSGFGQYSTILAYVYIFSILSDLGLYAVNVREISRPEAQESKIASNAFTLRFCSGLAFFSIGVAIAWLLPYDVLIKKGIFLASLGFWFLSNSQVLLGIFQKYLKLYKIALAEILCRFSQLGLVFLFVQNNLGFLAVVSAVAISGFIYFILVYYFAQRYIKVRLSFDFPFWFKLLKYSLPLAIASVFAMIYFKLDTVMLSLMKPASHVGIYNLGYKILESLTFFPHMIVGLAIPFMSKYAFTDKVKFFQVGQKVLDLFLVLVVPLIISILFLSPAIINLLGGPNFIASVNVLNILILALGIIFFGALFSNQLISLNKQNFLVWIYGLGALVNIILNLILIPKYSYYGAAFSTVLTELLVTVLMYIFLYKTIKYWFSFKIIFKIILAALVMVFVFYILSAKELSLAFIFSILTYLIIMNLFGGLNVLKKDLFLKH